ncbi:hypothetical protein ACP70R_047756 [Stipagrostis hirtigluma subsp. patula]
MISHLRHRIKYVERQWLLKQIIGSFWGKYLLKMAPQMPLPLLVAALQLQSLSPYDLLKKLNMGICFSYKHRYCHLYNRLLFTFGTVPSGFIGQFQDHRREVVEMVEEMFDQRNGPLVIDMWTEHSGGNGGSSQGQRTENVAVPQSLSPSSSLEQLVGGLKGRKSSRSSDISKLFRNKFFNLLPKIEEDRKIIISRHNLVLEGLGLSCEDLLHLKSEGIALTQTMIFAKGEYERNFISAVVPPNEIGVQFDDVGALEDVKKTLDELITLPMRRPKRFSHGNLLRSVQRYIAFWPYWNRNNSFGSTLTSKSYAECRCYIVLRQQPVGDALPMELVAADGHNVEPLAVLVQSSGADDVPASVDPSPPFAMQKQGRRHFAEGT